MALPREAREGLMRAWIAILSERYPDSVWVAAMNDGDRETDAPNDKRLVPTAG
jgi:hypothetical protein